MKERKWFVKYKNSGGFGEGMEVKGASEHDAILNVVDSLREDCDFITQLVNVEEIFDEIDEKEEDAKWSIKGGPVLGQGDQDMLNSCLDEMFNENGESLREAFDKEIEKRNK